MQRGLTPDRAAALASNLCRLGARLKESEGCEVMTRDGWQRVVRKGSLLVFFTWPDYPDGSHIGAVIDRDGPKMERLAHIAEEIAEVAGRLRRRTNER